MSISELKAALRSRGISIVGYTEKRELLELLEESMSPHGRSVSDVGSSASGAADCRQAGGIGQNGAAASRGGDAWAEALRAAREIEPPSPRHVEEFELDDLEALVPPACTGTTAEADVVSTVDFEEGESAAALEKETSPRPLAGVAKSTLAACCVVLLLYAAAFAIARPRISPGGARFPDE